MNESGKEEKRMAGPRLLLTVLHIHFRLFESSTYSSWTVAREDGGEGSEGKVAHDADEGLTPRDGVVIRPTIAMDAAAMDDFFPTVEAGLGRCVVKGEDFYAMQPAARSKAPGAPSPFKHAFFGVYDGHGGKHAGQSCAERLESLITTCAYEVARCDAGIRGSVGDEGSETFEAAERFVASLPRALSGGFRALDDACRQSELGSGTTATVAMVVGWELVVASVGDSLAYFSTGSQILQVSGNHRIDENKSEQQRIKDEGGKVGRAEFDGRGVGPLRIWPGGLAMSRTIGDRHAGHTARADPEVRQLSLPYAGGRLIVASDGLWDAVKPKQAFSAVKGLAPSAAARKLTKLSTKLLGKRDDITVVVADVSPPLRRLPAAVLASDAMPAPKQHHVTFPLRKPYASETGLNRFVYEEGSKACAAEQERAAALAAEAEAHGGRDDDSGMSSDSIQQLEQLDVDDHPSLLTGRQGAALGKGEGGGEGEGEGWEEGSGSTSDTELWGAATFFNLLNC